MQCGSSDGAQDSPHCTLGTDEGADGTDGGPRAASPYARAMVHAGEGASEVSSSATSAFADAETGGAAEGRRTAVALVVSVVLVAVLIGVVAVVVGLVVPNGRDRGVNLEATVRRDEFIDALRATPGVVYVVEPTDGVRNGGYGDLPERVDVTVSGTPAELDAAFVALCEHGGIEEGNGVGYVFDVATDVVPLSLRCGDPALVGRLTALVDLARDVPPSVVGSVKIAVSGAEVSVTARPSPEAMPEAWRWVSRWTTGVLDLGLTPVEVRFGEPGGGD